MHRCSSRRRASSATLELSPPRPAQDAKILREVAGEIAKGFIVGGAGASTPEIQSDAMKQFIDEYKKHVGEWNDEAGTKVYALELSLPPFRKLGRMP